MTTTIVPLNSAPTARGTTVNAPASDTGAVTGKANATDRNRDKLTYLATTTPDRQGSVTVNANGTFTYTPDGGGPPQRGRGNRTGGRPHRHLPDCRLRRLRRGHRNPGHGRDQPVQHRATGNAALQDPDATSGVVTGTVIGFDADGDGLTYSGSTTTAKGAVVVSADGAITYSPNDIARRIAASVYATPPRGDPIRSGG